MRGVSLARGFTLIELMICVAVMGIAAQVLPGFMHRLERLRRVTQARLEIERAGQTMALLLGRDIRGAGGVAPSFKGFSSAQRCLVLWAPRVAAGRRLIPDARDHIIYYLDPRDPAGLVKEVFPAAGSLRRATRQRLAANVLDLSFALSPQGGEARIVSWSAELGSRVDGRIVRRAFSSAAAFRRSRS